MRVRTHGIKINRISHIYATMGCLTWLLQIFSLDSTERRISKSEKWCYIIKGVSTALILATLSTFSFQYKCHNVFPSLNMSIILTDTIHMFFDFCQYAVDLIFIYKYGRETSQQYFLQYECFDKILNVSHYVEIRNRVTKLVCVFLMLFFISSGLDFTGWYLTYGITVPVVYSIAYAYLFIKILTNLDLTAQVINVECRLRVIGDLVQDSYDSTNCLPGESSTNKTLGESVTNKHWFYSDGCKRVDLMRCKVHPLKSISHTNYHEIKWLSRCYLLLNEQCTFISKFYGIRLMLNSLSLLIDMIRYLNVSFRLAVGSQKTPFSAGYFPVFATLMRVVLCSSVMTSVVRHCEQAYRQTDRISFLTDHILINKDPDEALRASISELRSLVQSRPICFNMAYFFRLSYPFLVSTASVVVTYTIILLQSV